ncbi:hypothetical protein T484DRAFT_2432591 [Baffinella frigidus]|nr:hypothetical protein T484DRAFT_2432591 [Cryptophyta sp. CCMP2293]
MIWQVCDKPVLKLEDLQSTTFDGSQTQQARVESSAVTIHPRALFHDPLRISDGASPSNMLVLCDCWSSDKRPVPSNTRHIATQLFNVQPQAEPWFTVEQEYTIFKDGKPLGWPSASARSFGGPTTQLGFPGPQGPYYCSVGSDVNFGREIAEAHLRACLVAGVKIEGLKAQAMPGQWSFSVGALMGIDMGDHLTMARYMLCRVSEAFGCVVSFDPKPIPGEWNGTACHTKFSTKKMRDTV